MKNQKTGKIILNIIKINTWRRWLINFILIFSLAILKPFFNFTFEILKMLVMTPTY
ncbi:hypothetical protein ECSTECEH250_2888 [Escherichia coli STEC_EH250]|nr:hypothetical protein ECSTECEH250_2888 [Escherichia coli STEC_EH250]KDT34044.1 hypothetical protein AC04_4095 [Escherichia coli 3-105-05_S3_C1]KDT48311.1 hypothetical protein AC32_3193 [Escherichia coli 3-105-05_S3_C2]